MRCPLALIKAPYTEAALDLYGSHRRGVTPRARGISGETAAYRVAMRICGALSEEAEAWYSKQSQPSDGGQ